MLSVNELERRIISEAGILIAENLTIRETAKRTSIPKSTIHNHMVKRLPMIDATLYFKVRKILDKNKSERHIRGGMATKRKYSKLVR